MSSALDFPLCRYFATRPRNCGGVAGQVIGFAADGTPIVWRCTFCADARPSTVNLTVTIVTEDTVSVDIGS